MTLLKTKITILHRSKIYYNNTTKTLREEIEVYCYKVIHSFIHLFIYLWLH